MTRNKGRKPSTSGQFTEKNGIGYGWDTVFKHGGCGWGFDRVENTDQKLSYEVFYWNQLRTLLIAQFTITGIESDMIDESIVSKLLTDYGVIVFFKDDVVGKLLALPCQIVRVGLNGKPTLIRAYSPFVPGYQVELKAGRDDFFVLWDSENRLNSRYFFTPWLTQLAEISVSIDVNLSTTRTPVMAVSSTEDRLAMENIVTDIIKGVPLVELKPRNGDITNTVANGLKTLKLDAPYIVDVLELERRTVWYSILEKIGYKVNVNPAKKERQIKDEVSGNLEETLGYYYSRKNPRMQAVEWLNDHGIKAELQENSSAKEGGNNGEIYDNASDILRESVGTAGE